MVDNWLIIGPGRTGSNAIVRTIYSLYGYKKHLYNYINPHTVPHSLSKGDIVHSHDNNWLLYATEYTRVIISTRDPVESALSWCIQPHLNKWHFYNNKKDIKFLNELQIKKFVLDPNTFLEHYNKVKKFYNEIKILPHYRVIDYSDWCNDPSKICTLLGINIKIKTNTLPLKNPGTPSDWIENFDEIFDIIKTLDRTTVNTKNPHCECV